MLAQLLVKKDRTAEQICRDYLGEHGITGAYGACSPNLLWPPPGAATPQPAVAMATEIASCALNATRLNTTWRSLGETESWVKWDLGMYIC